MFNVSESACNVLKDVIEREKQTPNEELLVRLSMGIGWGGPKLNLSLEERKITGDQLFEFKGVKLLIHEQDYVHFENTMLDYLSDEKGKFSFKLIKI